MFTKIPSRLSVSEMCIQLNIMISKWKVYKYNHYTHILMVWGFNINELLDMNNYSLMPNFYAHWIKTFTLIKMSKHASQRFYEIMNKMNDNTNIWLFIIQKFVKYMCIYYITYL